MVFFLPSFIDSRAPLLRRRKNINTTNGTLEQQKTIAHVRDYINAICQTIEREVTAGDQRDVAIRHLKQAATAVCGAILKPENKQIGTVVRHTPACIAKMRGQLKLSCPGCK